MKAVSSDYAPHVSAYTQYGLRKLTAVNKTENIFSFCLHLTAPPLIIVEVRENYLTKKVRETT